MIASNKEALEDVAAYGRRPHATGWGLSVSVT
jgi:hypothetical protein